MGRSPRFLSEGPLTLRESDRRIQYYLVELFCDMASAKTTFGDVQVNYLRNYWDAFARTRDALSEKAVVEAAVRSVLLTTLWDESGRDRKIASRQVPKVLSGVRERVARENGDDEHLSRALAWLDKAGVIEEVSSDLRLIRPHWFHFSQVVDIVDSLTAEYRETRVENIPPEAIESLTQGRPVSGIEDPLVLLSEALKVPLKSWDTVRSNAALLMTLWDISNQAADMTKDST